MKKCFVVFLIALGSCTTNHIPDQNKPLKSINKTISSSELMVQRNNLKGYAFCLCAESAFGNKTLNENESSSSLYFDMLIYPNFALSKIDSLSKNAGKSILFSTHFDLLNKKPIYYSCLEFYNSHLLDSIVKTFDKFFISVGAAR